MKQKKPMRNVLSIRDFRLLFAGTATSLLGDQFTLIATPWLVLQLTSNPLVNDDGLDGRSAWFSYV